MELFPAANQDQWSLIKQVIDDCDYYVLIVGGRYGSIGPDGVGYTEMEYRYAEEVGKPTIAFLHKDPDSLPAKKTERSDDGREKLTAFRSDVEQKMCKYWNSPAELGSVVSRSLVRLIKTTPGIGWVRANEIPDPEVAAENTHLRRTIEALQAEVAGFASRGPEGTEDLAQGEDAYALGFSVSVYDAETYGPAGPGKLEAKLKLTWTEIMKAVLPPLVVEGSEARMETALKNLFRQRKGPGLLDAEEGPRRGMNVSLSTLSRQQIVVQLRALGLITPSIKTRSLRDTATYWKLTPYGATVMNRLCALRSDSRMESPNEK